MENIEKISKINLFPDKKSIAIHVKSPNKIEKTVILRDEAIKNGAEGALILKYDKKLKFYDMDYKEDFSQIETEFDLKKNDVITKINNKIINPVKFVSSSGSS